MVEEIELELTGLLLLGRLQVTEEGEHRRSVVAGGDRVLQAAAIRVVLFVAAELEQCEAARQALLRGSAVPADPTQHQSNRLHTLCGSSVKSTDLSLFRHPLYHHLFLNKTAILCLSSLQDSISRAEYLLRRGFGNGVTAQPILNIPATVFGPRQIECIQAQQRNRFGLNLAQIARRLLGVVKLKLRCVT